MTISKNKSPSRKIKFVKVFIKGVLWMIATPIIIGVAVIIALQFSDVQLYVTNKATGYLSKKIKSRVTLQKINLVFPEMLELQDLFVADQKNDTLLFCHSIKVDVNLWDLLSHTITINLIRLQTATGHIYRNDGDFNLDFIEKAFSANEKKNDTAAQSASPWKFAIKAVELNDVLFSYHDKNSGITADITVGVLNAGTDAFDLKNKHIHFNKIRLSESTVALGISQGEKKSELPSKPFDYDLGVSSIELLKVKTTYNDQLNSQNLDLKVGYLALDAEFVDVKNLKFVLNKLVIKETQVNYTVDGAKQKITAASVEVNKAESATIAPWLFKIRALELDHNGFTYDNKNSAATKNVWNKNLLAASIGKVVANGIFLTPGKMEGHLEQFSLQEKNGFLIKKLKGDIKYDSTRTQLTALELETGASRLNGDFLLIYKSSAQFNNHIGEIKVDLRFRSALIASTDLNYFSPGLLNDVVKKNQQTKIRLSGVIAGTVDDLHFMNFEAATHKNTRLSLSGFVKNIRDPKNMFLSLNTFQIAGSEQDVKAIFSDSILPREIRIPARFNFKGAFTGYPKNFNAQLLGSTSIGNIAVTVKMNPTAGNSEQTFALDFSTDQLNAGKLLNQEETLGPVTMTGNITGTGRSFATLQLALNIKVTSAVVKKYDYKNLYAEGQFKDKGFTGKINIADDNLAFDFIGGIGFDPAKPNYVFTLHLKGADLHALHLTNQPFRVSALMQSDIQNRSDKNFIGKARLMNLMILRNDKKYPLDSIVLISEYSGGISKVSLHSEIMNLDFKGDITLNQLPAALKKHINNYFKLGAVDGGPLNAQKFAFEFKWTDPSLLATTILPELTKLEPFSIKGMFNSEAKKLDITGNIPQIIYSGVTVDSLNLNIHSDQEKLSCQLSLAEASNATFKFENVRLNNEFKNDNLSFQFNSYKDDSAKTFAIGGIINEKNKSYALKVNQDLTLNAMKWTVDPANSLMFGQKGITANQLVISKDSSRIGLNSTGQVADAPIELKFSNFDLITISKLIENNNHLLAGKVNGNIIFKKQNSISGFRSDLVIDDFVFTSVPIGTVKVKADNTESSQKYNLELAVDGNGNQLNCSGYFLTSAKENNLNFEISVNNLNLAAVEPFTFGQITHMSGSMNGKLNLSGSPGSPGFTGELNFKEGAFRPRIIDSYLKIHEGKMRFESKKLLVSNLLVYDSLNNMATLNGFAGIADFKNINFDAQVKTNNFLALNTVRSDNPLYFGRIFLDSDIRIRGTLDAPEVDVKARLNKGSFITYVKPETEVGKNESKGIVEFTDSLYHPGIMTRTNNSSKSTSDLKGIDLTASIAFDKSVELKMLVDQDSGDSLYMKGGGDLDFTLDKTGRTTLAGKYKISDGGYHLAISDLVKRNFKIEKGSSVTWSGNPLEPYVDLKAIYIIKTSPVDLVQDELNGMSELEKNKYRNLLTFYVYLKMTGFISAPDISFDIQLAPGDRGTLNGTVDSKLAQLRADETELNKQVFALLTLRRFISDNPLDNGNDGGITSASRTSASQVLTQQLSRLSDKYVNFVDLDLGVNSFEDFSSGVAEGRTQLQVGVSKQLLNEKVTVRVGGNVELEGERASQNNANDVAGNVSIDYRLTQDGRFKLRAFRKNQYENPIEGELTKTGVGIVFIRNFLRFKELLKKPGYKVKQEIKVPIDADDNDN